MSLDCYTGCIDSCGGFCGTGKQFCPCIFCFCVQDETQIEIPQGNIGLLTKFGKYSKTMTSGTYFVNPFTEKLKIVKKMMQTCNLARQIILTKDNIQATIDASVNYQIMDPIITEYTIFNTDESIIHLCYSVLRSVTGQYDL